VSARPSLDDYVEIPIWRGRVRSLRIAAFAKVDPCDAPTVNTHEWRFHQGYALCRSPRCTHSERLFMHRMIVGLGADDGIHYCDHINMDKLDNRRRNLRIVTRAENNQNQAGRGRTSQYRGVSWMSDRRIWTARVTVSGRLVYCGYFHDEIAAATAARDARRRFATHSVEESS